MEHRTVPGEGEPFPQQRLTTAVEGEHHNHEHRQIQEQNDKHTDERDAGEGFQPVSPGTPSAQRPVGLLVFEPLRHLGGRVFATFVDGPFDDGAEFRRGAVIHVDDRSGFAVVCPGGRADIRCFPGILDFLVAASHCTHLVLFIPPCRRHAPLCRRRCLPRHRTAT